jgi:hypothetical protein
MLNEILELSQDVRYGNFFEFVAPAPWGHVSVCLEPGADPVALGARVLAVMARHAG